MIVAATVLGLGVTPMRNGSTQLERLFYYSMGIESVKNHRTTQTEVNMDHTLEDNGDALEKQHWHYLKTTFPNYELFWQHFIVPLSQRPNGINWRLDIHPLQKQLCLSHYSVFYHLAMARYLKDVPDHLFFEAVFAYLQSAIENVRHFLLVLISLQAALMQPDLDYECTKTAQQLLRQKTKPQLQQLETIGKCLDTLYKGSPSSEKHWNTYKTLCGQIGDYRNYFVHAPKGIGFVNSDGNIMVPTLEHLDEYSWTDLKDHCDCQMKPHHFKPLPDITNQLQTRLEKAVNEIWVLPMHLMKKISGDPQYEAWAGGSDISHQVPADTYKSPVTTRNIGHTDAGTANWPMGSTSRGTSYSTKPLD